MSLEVSPPTTIHAAFRLLGSFFSSQEFEGLDLSFEVSSRVFDEESYQRPFLGQRKRSILPFPIQESSAIHAPQTTGR